MIEMEYKAVVDKDRFDELRNMLQAECGQPMQILQVNYYYDDENNTLNNHNITLRVRQADGVLTLQRKIHCAEKELFVISDENESVLRSLPKMIRGKYTLKGSLITQRLRFTLDSLCVDFDANYYLGVCDYEIELEFDESAAEQAQRYISLLGAGGALHKRGKSLRFFERLREYTYEQA